MAEAISATADRLKAVDALMVDRVSPSSYLIDIMARQERRRMIAAMVELLAALAEYNDGVGQGVRSRFR